MFLVSGPELVLAACKAGMIGAFPAPNCRTIEALDSWMRTITEALGPQDAAWAFNMVTHSSYPRFEAELELVKAYQPPLVITALGGPQRVIETVHAYGGTVFADVNSVPFARKAAAAGADGLALVCAGAGGHTGWMSNVAFIEAVRTFFDGPIAVGGGISTGQGVAAVEAMGADLAYLGTAFIAAEESLAHPDYKTMVIESDSTDLVVSASVTGVPASWLRPSLERAGLDPDAMPKTAAKNFGDPEQSLKGWKDIWSAGQGVGGVKAVEPAARIIERLVQQYLDQPDSAASEQSQPVQSAAPL